MKEVKAENPIEVTAINDGVEIEIPGDRAPMVPLVVLVLLAMFVFMGTEGKLWWMSIALLGFCVWGYRFHKKSQFITLTSSHIMAKDKSFDLSKITSIELGNAMDKVPLAQHQGSVTVISGGGAFGATAATGAVLGDAMGRAMMGAINMSLKSGAKKAYYVKISYGTKKYMIANRMRLPRAEALYKYLTNPSS